MAAFKANGKEYELPTELTLGEMCDAEELFGVEFGNTNKSSMRLGAALVWIALHREDPNVKPEDIRGLPASLFADVASDASPPALELVDANATTGPPSEPISEDPAADLSHIGGRGSDTGSASARETFFTSLSAN